jgi:hypothetical protein
VNLTTRRLCRLYGWLVRVYPEWYRHEFGAEMQAVFEQAAEEAASRGWAALARLVGREARDWPVAVWAAYRQASARKERLAMVNGIAAGSRPRWHFYLGWIAVSAACIPVAWFIAWVVIGRVQQVVGGRIQVGGQSHITEDFLLSYIFFPVLSLLTGLAQYFILRRYLPRVGWWPAATLLGWLLPFVIVMPLVAAVGREVRLALDVPREVSVVASAAMLGGLVALPQWWLLRRRVRRAGWWLVVNVIGWGVLALLTGRSIDRAADEIAAIVMPPLATGVALWLLLNRLPRRAPPSGQAS